MAPAKFEYFFDLPPELREQILAHVCVFPTGIWVGGGDDDDERSIPLPRSSARGGTPTILTQQFTTATQRAGSENDYADPPVNLFLASPVLYRAAGDLYYGRNVFHLDFSSYAWGRKQKSQLAAAARGGGAGGCGGALWRLLTHPHTALARRRMRSVVVYVRRLGELVAGVLAPALGDMVLNGMLTRVRVDLLELGVRGRGGMVWTVNHAGNPALRALLVLLTDPNLERAGLRVLREQHAPFWCRFHRGGGVPSSSSQDGGSRVEEGGCVMIPQNGGLRGVFVDVDIPSLVAVCAGDSAEFNIKKVE